MADVTQDVILSFNAETGGVDKQVEDLTKAVEELSGAIDGMGMAMKDNAKDFGKSAKDMQKDAKETADEIEDVGKKAKEGGSGLAEFGALGQEAIGPLDELTGGMATKFVDSFGAVKKLASGMKLLKLAVAGTGIGLLVVALGAVATALAQNEGFIKKLRKSMLWMEPLFTLLKDTLTDFGNAIIDAFSKPGEFIEDAKKAVMGFGDTIKEYVLGRIELLMEGLGMLGSAITKLFEGDFKGALADAGEGFLNVQRAVNPVVMATEAMVNVVGDVVEATQEWVESTQPLVNELDALDNATKRNAKQQKELAFETQMSALANEELKRAINDTTLSFEDRLMIAQKVADEEQKFADAQVQLSEKAVANAQEQIRLRGASEENLQRLKDAQIALAEAQAKSLETEAQGQAVLAGIEKERADQQGKIAEMQDGWTAKKLEGIEAEKQAVKDQLEADLQAIEELNLEESEKEALRQQARQTSNKRLEAIDEKFRQQELKARQDLEDELFALTQGAEDKEILSALQAYDRRVAIAGDDEGLLRLATEQLNKELGDINTKYRTAEEQADKAAADKRLAQEKEIAGKVKGVRDASIQAIADLSQAFGGITVEQERERAEREQAIQDETYQNGLRLMELERQASMEQDQEKKAQLEKQLREEQYQADLRVYNLELENYNKNRALDEQARKQFEIQKAVSIAQAAIAQGESAIQAYKSVVGIPVVGPGLAVAAAAAAVAAGAAQIQGIRRQTYQSTAGEAPTPPQRQLQPVGGVPGTEQGGIGGGPQLDLSFLGEGAGTSGPIQAYVLAQDVSTAQQATQKIEDQATL